MPHADIRGAGHSGVPRDDRNAEQEVGGFRVVERSAGVNSRLILGGKVTEFSMARCAIRVAGIPPGMTHSIENVGTTEMILLFSASWNPDPGLRDTYVREVLHG